MCNNVGVSDTDYVRLWCEYRGVADSSYFMKKRDDGSWPVLHINESLRLYCFGCVVCTSIPFFFPSGSRRKPRQARREMCR